MQPLARHAFAPVQFIVPLRDRYGRGDSTVPDDVIENAAGGANQERG
jgi:hypothetical protein